jgi:voltage-gated potassium channel
MAIPMPDRPTSRTTFRRLELGIVVLVLLIVIGVVGYVGAGWELVESFYFVIITIFGIGFEEVRDVDTTALRLFTIFIIIAGTSAIFYTVGGLFEMVTQGEIRRAFSERRKTQGIETQTDHVIICGYGRMGEFLARELKKSGTPFVVIDNDEQRGRAAEAEDCLVLIGDATEEETLKSARIEHASTVATVLPSDAKNVFITLSARTLNAKLSIIARGELPSTEAKLQQAGADHVVLPAAIGGHRIASMIRQPAMGAHEQEVAGEGKLADDLRELGVYFNEIPVPADSTLIGKPLSEVQLGDEALSVVVGLKRGNGESIFRPPPETLMAANDTLIVLGAYGDSQGS